MTPHAPPSSCGALPFRIRRDGTWLHEGAPIARPALRRLFAGALRRDEAGQYWLRTPAERGRIAVDCTPFLAVAMEARGAGAAQVLIFRTDLDELVSAGPAHPIRLAPGPDGAPEPRLSARPGDGAWPLEARIARAAYYDMAALAAAHSVEGRERHGVWSGGVFFPLEP